MEVGVGATEVEHGKAVDCGRPRGAEGGRWGGHGQGTRRWKGWRLGLVTRDDAVVAGWGQRMGMAIWLVGSAGMHDLTSHEAVATAALQLPCSRRHRCSGSRPPATAALDPPGDDRET